MTEENNALSRLLDQNVVMDMNIGIDDMVAIASSKQERIIKEAIKRLQKELNDLEAEIKKENKTFRFSLKEVARSLLENKVKQFNTLAETLLITSTASIGEAHIKETEEGELKFSTTVTIDVATGYSRSGIDSSEHSFLIHKDGGVYNLIWEGYYHLEDLREKQTSTFNKLSEMRRALNDISSLERQAKGQLAEATLENSEAGRMLLERLDSMDTSYLIETETPNA